MDYILQQYNKDQLSNKECWETEKHMFESKFLKKTKCLKYYLAPLVYQM